ncbi:MAG: bifunctional phosphopantothenoylcysteine decarboxylase/phosphopantothenate--cysteine ligase CoaBC [Candidatus Margulisiibacteriota bacterium]|jgi:phosphopantothenoylcysteine decarboxylase/phosphopantothenate--cysteine ligase
MNRKIILGITGSIAAYKTPELIRLLKKENIEVTPVVTENALKFVTELTLETVAEEIPLKDNFVFQKKIPHLNLSKTKDLLIIAPASANIIAKIANGLADNLLTSLFLSFDGPKLIVPAMHSSMFLNKITQANIKKLSDLGIEFLGPETGHLASGDNGIGRMVELELITEKIKSLLLPPLNLKNKKILITSGGTTEPIDQVRYITNKSTGKFGHTLANLASFYGAYVTLITTKEPLANPEFSKIIKVSTCSEMAQAVKENINNHDYLFMAAAVSDYTIANCAKSKIKRENSLLLELTGTEDILKNISKDKKNKVLIGFCLDTEENLIEKAKIKFQEKNLDYIIANSPEVIGQNKRTLHLIDKNKIITYNDSSLFDLSYALLKEIIK